MSRCCTGTATHSTCRQVRSTWRRQAIAVAGHALGFQFHPEAQETGFERWLIGHDCEIDAAPGVTVPDLREQMRRHGALASEKDAAVLRRWLDGLT